MRQVQPAPGKRRDRGKILGIEYEIEKVNDIDKIMSFGVMVTPALAIDGVVKAAGKILTSDEIKELLK